MKEFKDIRNDYKFAMEDPSKDQREYKKKLVIKDLEQLKAATKGDDLRNILEWERKIGIISVQDMYKLNGMEWSTIKAGENSGEFECIKKLPSPGILMNVGQKGKFKRYFDETRGKDVYVFFYERTIEPEEQIDAKLARKINQGFMPEQKDYAKPKIQYRRNELVETEFNKYFQAETVI